MLFQLDQFGLVSYELDQVGYNRYVRQAKFGSLGQLGQVSQVSLVRLISLGQVSQDMIISLYQIKRLVKLGTFD